MSPVQNIDNVPQLRKQLGCECELAQVKDPHTGCVISPLLFPLSFCLLPDICVLRRCTCDWPTRPVLMSCFENSIADDRIQPVVGMRTYLPSPKCVGFNLQGHPDGPPHALRSQEPCPKDTLRAVLCLSPLVSGAVMTQEGLHFQPRALTSDRIWSDATAEHIVLGVTFCHC